MANSQSRESELLNYIAKKLNIDIHTISMDSYFSTDLKLGSVQAIELIADFEIQFNCKIPDDKIGELLKISDLLQYME